MAANRPDRAAARGKVDSGATPVGFGIREHRIAYWLICLNDYVVLCSNNRVGRGDGFGLSVSLNLCGAVSKRMNIDPGVQCGSLSRLRQLDENVLSRSSADDGCEGGRLIYNSRWKGGHRFCPQKRPL